MTTARAMVSKVQSRCVKCGEAIDVGEPILWHGPGQGAEHEDCPETDGMNQEFGSHEEVLGWDPGS